MEEKLSTYTKTLFETLRNKMTIIHPNGVKFEYVSDLQYFKVMGGYYAWRRGGIPGVWITLPCGTRIFRPNEYYQHITGLPLAPGEVYQCDL